MLANLYVKKNLSHTGNLQVKVITVKDQIFVDSNEYTFKAEVISLHSGQELATLFTEYDELVFVNDPARIINIKNNTGEKNIVGASDILTLTGTCSI